MVVRRFGRMRVFLHRCADFWLQERLDCALEAEKVLICTALSSLLVRTERLHLEDYPVHSAAAGNHSCRSRPLLLNEFSAARSALS